MINFFIQLISLDTALANLHKELVKLEESKGLFLEKLTKVENKLKGLRTKHEQLLVEQQEAEEKLREEQQKIIERRRQLMAVGGSKSARLLEREVEKTGFLIKTIETNVIEIIERAEECAAQREEVEQEYAALIAEQEKLAPEWSKLEEGLLAQKGSNNAGREELLQNLNNTSRQVYLRVNMRYPGTAIALADNGFCAGCARTLPAQVYNVVRTGKELVQCPGCVRILVTTPEADLAESGDVA